MGTLRERILNADDSQKQTVTIPQWDNVTVEIRALTFGQRLKCRETATVRRGTAADLDQGRWEWEVIKTAVCDPETGTPVFQDADRELMYSKNEALLRSLYESVILMSALDAGAIATAAKNSKTTPSDGTATN